MENMVQTFWRSFLMKFYKTHFALPIFEEEWTNVQFCILERKKDEIKYLTTLGWNADTDN